MYICIYVYVCVCVCIHMHESMCTCMCVCVYIYIYIYACVCVCVCVCACTPTHTPTHTHTHIHRGLAWKYVFFTRMHAYIRPPTHLPYTHTHTHTHAWKHDFFTRMQERALSIRMLSDVGIGSCKNLACARRSREKVMGTRWYACQQSSLGGLLFGGILRGMYEFVSVYMNTYMRARKLVLWVVFCRVNLRIIACLCAHVHVCA